MRQSYKTVLLWLLFAMMFVSIWQLFSAGNGHPDTKITLSDLSQKVREEPEKIAKVRISGQEYAGEYKDGTRFRAVGPVNPDEFIKELQHAGKEGTKMVPYEIELKPESVLWPLLSTGLPLIAVVVVFFLFMRQLQAGGGKAMSFGKSKAKLIGEHQNKITFADVAGVEEAKDEVEEIIDFLKDPKKFTKLGGRIPKGVLMMGPPGTGKTLLARAIAGEAGVPFFSISGSDFVEMFVGVGASRVRDLFEQGKKNAPCIIFIDEIDAVGRHRGAGLGGGHDEREQTLNQLLVEMDGFESNDGVILIAATNRPDVLDPALLRPGRFDRRIIVPRPDVRGREGILKVHVRKVPLAKDAHMEVIAKGTPGFSGADLESLVNEAALLAARRGKDQVDMADFEEAKDKVLMGPERRSMVISEKEKRTTAYHEAGHAVVAKILPGSDPLHKVTIIPRGPTLGVTQQLPNEDRHSYSKDWAQNRIAICLGGRIAEELIFGEMTTGAGNDIEKATELARKMVCEWGMSEKLGPLTFGKKEEQIFLGREFAQHQDYSEQTAVEIDAEVKRIVTDGYRAARKVLEEHLDLLKRLAEALLEHETIDGADIELLFQGKSIHRPPPPPRIPVVEPVREKRPSPLFARPPALKEEPEKA